jgi:bifunctional non-homologous end joining protein LigD
VVVVAGVTITHPERELFAAPAIAKGELAAYVELVAPWMLPHVQGRPLQLLRCPDGVGEGCFVQRHWTVRTTKAVRTVDVAEADGDTSPYAVVTDAAGLATLVQHGAVEVHAWQSRADRLDRPDRLVLDLDPAPGVTWARVVAGAQAIRELLQDAGLASWCKVSGGKGVHVVAPLDRRLDWEAHAAFARGLAERLAHEEPDAYVAGASKADREGRIYVDWVRNVRGATAIAPWSPRARDGAPVAVPLPWDELRAARRADRWGVRDVPALLREWGDADPWADLARTRQSIGRNAWAVLGIDPP